MERVALSTEDGRWQEVDLAFGRLPWQSTIQGSLPLLALPLTAIVAPNLSSNFWLANTDARSAVSTPGYPARVFETLGSATGPYLIYPQPLQHGCVGSWRVRARAGCGQILLLSGHIVRAGVSPACTHNGSVVPPTGFQDACLSWRRFTRVPKNLATLASLRVELIASHALPRPDILPCPYAASVL